jgi:hypothetical protein
VWKLISVAAVVALLGLWAGIAAHRGDTETQRKTNLKSKPEAAEGAEDVEG